MNKIVLLLAALATAGIATLKMTETDLELPYDWTAAQKQQEAIVNYECFKHTFENSLEKLGEGEISLQDAQERVCAASRCYRPDYLTWLVRAEAGTTDSERVARSLVGHLQLIADAKPRLRPRAAELEIELQDFLYELAPRSCEQ